MFEIKHALADWFFQDSWISQGKRLPWFNNWIGPLAYHSATHGFFTLMIITGIGFFVPYVYNELLWLVGLDLVSHFIIDRIKSAPNLLGQFGKTNISWWIITGLDQLAHHAVYCFMIFKIGSKIT